MKSLVRLKYFVVVDDDNENRPESPENEVSAGASGTAEQGEEPFVVSPPKWSKAMRYKFSKHPVDLSFDKSKMIFDKCGNSLPLFFSSIDLIVLNFRSTQSTRTLRIVH